MFVDSKTPLVLEKIGNGTVSHKFRNQDTADDDIIQEEKYTFEYLLELCHSALKKFPDPIHRSFVNIRPNPSSTESIRVLQWNILAQTLATNKDSFITCPRENLEWFSRRWKILEEIIANKPDVICLQEVDHFKFLKKYLDSVVFDGFFFPKPDSPCCDYQNNNGPDGCAFFFNSSKFSLIKLEMRVLNALGYATNQVAIFAILRLNSNNQEIGFVTTHLKAKYNPSFVALRKAQGEDILNHCDRFFKSGTPFVMSGDFNAEPTEQVYQLIMQPHLGFESAYRSLTLDGQEPNFTTWKVREEGEICHTIDYQFYTKDLLEVTSLLDLPTEEEIGPGRLPSVRYPSDHLSLVSDFIFK